MDTNGRAAMSIKVELDVTYGDERATHRRSGPTDIIHQPFMATYGTRFNLQSAE
jgi:hypothetical protein